MTKLTKSNILLCIGSLNLLGLSTYCLYKYKSERKRRQPHEKILEFLDEYLQQSPQSVKLYLRNLNLLINKYFKNIIEEIPQFQKIRSNPNTPKTDFKLSDSIFCQEKEGKEKKEVPEQMKNKLLSFLFDLQYILLQTYEITQQQKSTKDIAYETYFTSLFATIIQGITQIQRSRPNLQELISDFLFLKFTDDKEYNEKVNEYKNDKKKKKYYFLNHQNSCNLEQNSEIQMYKLILSYSDRLNMENQIILKDFFNDLQVKNPILREHLQIYWQKKENSTKIPKLMNLENINANKFKEKQQKPKKEYKQFTPIKPKKKTEKKDEVLSENNNIQNSKSSHKRNISRPSLEILDALQDIQPNKIL